MKQFELFAHNTPLGVVTAGATVSESAAPSLAPKEESTIEGTKALESVVTGLEPHSQGTTGGEGTSVDVDPAATIDPSESEGEVAKVGVVSPGAASKEETDKATSESEELELECEVTASDLVLEEAAASGTYVAIHLCVNDISNSHLNEYYKSMIQYAEEWDLVVSNRIKAGLYEFNKLCDDLHHYTVKVNKLRAVKAPSKKLEGKLYRNEQKLVGAQEAHKVYSDHLYMYIEEVADRAWKDLYPLLLNAFEFDLNYCAGQFKFFSHLTQSIEKIKQVGTDYGLHAQGRLAQLDADPMQNVYTGPGYGQRRSFMARSHRTDSLGSEVGDVHDWAHASSAQKQADSVSNPAA